jgi:hypothetical protein
MSTTALIVRDDARLQVAFTTTAIALRDEALAIAGLVGKVTNDTENAAAVKAQMELTRVRQQAEKARKECKEPVIRFGKQIDDTARQFMSDIDSEMLRIGRLVGNFAALEQLRLREQQKAQQEALNKIEREKAAALAQAKTHEQADAIAEHFDQKAKLESAPLTVARESGQVIRQDWSIQVFNPYELARYHPECVNITPKLGEIKSLLNQGIAVKGVKAEKVTNATVRVGNERPAIDVG